MSCKQITRTLVGIQLTLTYPMQLTGTFVSELEKDQQSNQMLPYASYQH